MKAVEDNAQGVINDDVKERQQQLLRNQIDIQTMLESLDKSIEAMTGSLQRIFTLYEEHDKEINENCKEIESIRIFMAERAIMNGNSDKSVQEVLADIHELNKTRQPILDRLTVVEHTKADKEDVANIREDISKGREQTSKEIATISTTLDSICKDNDIQREDHKFYLTRKDAYVGIIIGAVIGIISILAYTGHL